MSNPYEGTNARYYSQGAGDVTITAECMNLQKTYELQDCTYWNDAEVIRNSTQGSTIYDNNMAIALPTNCEISFDAWSDVSLNDGQHRFFLLPKTQYSSGTTQPSYAIWVDYIGGSNLMQFGKRENSSTIALINFSISLSTYHTIKIVKTGTSIEMYADDVLKTTQTLSWIDNYSDYCFSMMRWSASGTSKLRNVKIKPLHSLSISANKDILSYADEDECVLTATLTGDDVSNKPVVFKKGNTVLDTVNTDSNGVATYTYSSQGAGDVTFTVECMNLQETYSIQDYLQIPTLNGDNIYQINGTTTVSNGEMSGGSAYLSLGFDNTGDWELNCKFKINGRNCALSLFPNGATAREQNELGMSAYRTNTFWFNNGTFVELYTSNRDLSGGNWYDVKITKQNGVLTTLIDGVTRTISNWDILSSASSFHIGVSGWGTNYNTATIKDVVVKPL